MTQIVSNPSMDAIDPEPEVRLSENATRVLEARYLKKEESGEVIEAPADLFRRVARTIAEPETGHGATEAEPAEWEDRFYRRSAGGEVSGPRGGGRGATAAWRSGAMRGVAGGAVPSAAAARLTDRTQGSVSQRAGAQPSPTSISTVAPSMCSIVLMGRV